MIVNLTTLSVVTQAGLNVLSGYLEVSHFGEYGVVGVDAHIQASGNQRDHQGGRDDHEYAGKKDLDRLFLASEKVEHLVVIILLGL